MQAGGPSVRSTEWRWPGRAQLVPSQTEPVQHNESSLRPPVCPALDLYPTAINVCFLQLRPTWTPDQFSAASRAASSTWTEPNPSPSTFTPDGDTPTISYIVCDGTPMSEQKRGRLTVEGERARRRDDHIDLDVSVGVQSDATKTVGSRMRISRSRSSSGMRQQLSKIRWHRRYH